MTFQWLKVIMTSSRRHFVKINSWPYLHNRKPFLIHIYHHQGQYLSGQFQVNKCAQKCAYAYVRALMRAIFFKLLKIVLIFFYISVSGHYKDFIKNRANAHFRAFSFVTTERKLISRQFFWQDSPHICPNNLIPCLSLYHY